MTNLQDDFADALDARMPERKQRGRPRASGDSRAPRASKINLANLKKNAVAGLRTINDLAIQYIRGYAMYSIQPDEFEPLAGVIAAEVEASPRMQKMLASAGKIGTHGGTIFVLGQMLMRRYPVYLMQKANANAGTNPGPDFEATVSMETGGAYGGDRGYRHGENIPHIPIVNSPELYPESQEQERQYQTTG